jgi:hypothetical protein
LLATFWLLSGLSTAAAIELKSGREFEQGRSQTTSVFWQQMPIGRGLKSLTETHKMAIVLDRRVDPARRCSCDLTDIPFEEALRQIAIQQQLGTGTVGSVFLVGPGRTTVLLATAAEIANEKHASFSEPLRAKLMRRKAWSWKRLSTPGALVAELAEEAGLTVVNPQVLPHDLWDQRVLPPLTWAERMLVVLAGFDLYFDVDPDRQSVVITKLPSQLSLRRTYRVKGDADPLAQRLSEQFPRAFFQVQGKVIAVRSLVEDHWKIERLLKEGAAAAVDSGRPSQVDPDMRRYTLTVQDELVEPLLRVLARRTGHTLVIDDSAQPAMTQRVSFAVQEVTAEELFRNAVASLNLSAELRDGQVVVTAPSSR